MAESTTSSIGTNENDITDGLGRLASIPGWLRATLQPESVADALRRAEPALASGDRKLRAVKVKRLHLQDDSGRWVGTYQLSLDTPSGKHNTALRGTFTRPRRAVAGTTPAGAPFGDDGWRGALPELGLEFEVEPPESELPALPALTDPEQSRALLEAGIRASSADYANIRIAECRPEVLSYKPGSRCTIRYHLTYPPEQAGEGWPTTVIAKTYRKESKGRNAYEGMVALWRSPLAHSDAAAIAEPLALIPEQKVMVQGPVAGDRSLEDVLKSALKTGDPAALAEVESLMRRAGAGLAAFHRSGARHGATVTLDDRYDEIASLIARLLIPVPELAGAAEPLLAALRAHAAELPADMVVPTHGTFSPEQVLLDGGHVGLIDFDDFSMAEPGLDVGLFLAAIRDIGMGGVDSDNPAERQARLALLDRIGEAFQSEYERNAPVSRGRVALWEAWSYFRDVLHTWIKVKPAESDTAMLTLLHHLRKMGLLVTAEE
jgi:aminoglycoside phosphotransferase (APT) family kinase protein